MKYWQALVVGIALVWLALISFVGLLWAVQNVHGFRETFGWIALVTIVSATGAMFGSNWWYERNSEDNGRGY